MKIALASALGLSLLVSAAAAETPPATGATLTLGKGFKNSLLALWSGATRYTVYDAGNCDSYHTTDTVLAASTRPKPGPISAAGLVVVTAETTLSPLTNITGGNGDHDNECSGSAAFTPEAGHAYMVTHRASDGGCHMEVLDTTSAIIVVPARIANGVECKAFLDPAWKPKAG